MGLVPSAYSVGSWHSALTPELVSSSIAAEGVRFKWKAKGTSIYSVTAIGRLRYENNKFVGLNVDCSCPDGVRQKILSLQHGEMIVCKHGAAALKSVEDPDAIVAAAAQAKRQKTEQDEQRRLQKTKQDEQRRLQDAQLPGERERIDYGLKHLSAEAVVKHLTSIAHSVDGLRQLAALFPESVMPKPSVMHCLRCDTDYDPRYCSNKVSHPEADVSQRWNGSKKSWDECGRCGKTFNCDGMHGMDRRAVMDEGPWCFEGKHTTDEAVEEGWDEDDCSYLSVASDNKQVDAQTQGLPDLNNLDW